MMKNKSADREYTLHYPYWKASLSNGLIVTDDNSYEGSSWQLLKRYCEDNSVYVTELSLHFRKNCVYLPPDKEAFFLRYSILGFLGGQRNFIIMGYLQDGKVYAEKWSVPELVFEELSIRTLEESENSLIWKK